jgi:hypothetical protein
MQAIQDRVNRRPMVEVTRFVTATWWVGAATFHASREIAVLYAIAMVVGLAISLPFIRAATVLVLVLFSLAIPAVGVAVMWVLLKLLFVVVFVLIGAIVWITPQIPSGWRQMFDACRRGVEVISEAGHHQIAGGTSHFEVRRKTGEVLSVAQARPRHDNEVIL